MPLSLSYSGFGLCDSLRAKQGRPAVLREAPSNTEAGPALLAITCLAIVEVCAAIPTLAPSYLARPVS
jgi:hypothetical protein